MGGDPGDGDFVQTGADVETAWMRLGFRVTAVGVGGSRDVFLITIDATWRRAGVRWRRTATGAGMQAGVRGATYSDGRAYGVGVGIPIPNMK